MKYETLRPSAYIKYWPLFVREGDLIRCYLRRNGKREVDRQYDGVFDFSARASNRRCALELAADLLDDYIEQLPKDHD